MSKKLVTYFSATGVTKRIAEELAEVVGGDLYEIRPETAYTADDLNFRDKHSRSSVEMNDPASRPALAEKDADIAPYDVIYVGYPIWWGVCPRVVNTFLESYDFSGKTIIPFATSGGSGIGKTDIYLAPSAPGAEVKEGKRLGGTEDMDALKVWVAGYVL
jgi:flavodoxin